MSQEDQKPSSNEHEIISLDIQKETAEVQQQDDLSPGPANAVDTSNTTAGSVAQQTTENQSFILGFQQGYRAGHADGFAEGIKHAKILDERTQYLLQQSNPQLAAQQQPQQLQPEENLSSASTVDNCTDHTDGGAEDICYSNILDERTQHLLQQANPQQANPQQDTQQQSQQQLGDNSSSASTADTWAGLAQFISAEDYQEFSKIPLTNQQAHELVALSSTRLKSSTKARILHFFLGGFGAAYIYLNKSERAVLHSLVTICLIMFGMFNNLDIDYRYNSSASTQNSHNLLIMLNAVWGLVLFIELFDIVGTTRETNSQIIRDWLKKSNLLEDTKA